MLCVLHLLEVILKNENVRGRIKNTRHMRNTCDTTSENKTLAITKNMLRVCFASRTCVTREVKV